MQEITMTMFVGSLLVSFSMHWLPFSRQQQAEIGTDARSNRS
jgi:hypothetical protein